MVVVDSEQITSKNEEEISNPFKTEKIKLVPVTDKYKNSVMNYKTEFIVNKDSLNGTSGLRKCETFEKWVTLLIDNSKEETVKDGLVPTTTLLAVSNKDARLIGMVNIRHRLSESLLNYSGHIGYSVRKIERNKGFASHILSLALKECSVLNIKKVLVSCDKNNLASAKTIIKNNGILENEVEDETRVIQRYWITL